MSYLDITIKEIVSKISNNEVYLPAIQRKFVWNQDQIKKLFDSIMLGVYCIIKVQTSAMYLYRV